MYCLNYADSKYTDTIEENYSPLVFISISILNIVILSNL